MAQSSPVPNVADTNVGDTNVGGTNAAHTNVVDTKVADTNVGGINGADISVGDTNVGDINHGDTSVADTNVVESDKNVADTNIGETNAADTNVGDKNIANANVDRDQEQGNRFRIKLSEALIKHGSRDDSGPDLESFMLEEHPRGAWLKTLLSAAFWPAKSPPHMWMDNLIEKFPDILQRELLRDDGSSSDGGLTHYPALYTALILGRTKIVELVTDWTRTRNRGLERLLEIPDLKNGDGFKAIHRAVLWAHVEEISQAWGPVSTFLNRFAAARNPTTDDDGQKMKMLIEGATIDTRNLWLAVLLWASVFNCAIVKEFKELKPDLFRDILADLKDVNYGGLGRILQRAARGIQDAPNPEKKLKDIVKLVTKQDKGLGSSKMSTNVGLRLMSTLHGPAAAPRLVDREWTALHLAAASGDEDMVEALIKFYDQSPHELLEQLDFSDASWMTPLHYAVLGNHKKVIEKFVDWKFYQSYVNDFDVFFRTAFHMACSGKGKTSTLEVLMKMPNIDVNIKDCCHFTPLHWAVHTGTTTTIQLLLSPSERGRQQKWISWTEEDIDGRQAFDIAVKNGTWKQLTNLPEMQPQVERLYKDRQLYVDAANAILVGAALIASVTFGGWLQPPLGDQGDSTEMAVEIFWVCNSLSFFFSIGTVLAAAGDVLPNADGSYSIGNSVKSIRRWLIATSFLLVVSVVFVLGAFAAAGFSSLSLVPHLNHHMIITTAIGVIVCSTVGGCFLRRLYHIRPEWLTKRFLYRIRPKWLTRDVLKVQLDGFWGGIKACLVGPYRWIRKGYCGDRHNNPSRKDWKPWFKAIIWRQPFSTKEENPVEDFRAIQIYLKEKFIPSHEEGSLGEGERRRKCRKEWKDKNGVHGRPDDLKMKPTFSCRSCAQTAEEFLFTKIQMAVEVEKDKFEEIQKAICVRIDNGDHQWSETMDEAWKNQPDKEWKNYMVMWRKIGSSKLSEVENEEADP